MTRRCRTIASVVAFKKGTVLDIGDSSGEYNIESAGTLAATLAAARRPMQQEPTMQESRRSLLRSIAGAVVTYSMAVSAARGQDPFPKAPTPLHPGEDEPVANPNAKSPTKIHLEENQKDINTHIEKLFDLASHLKHQ